MSTRKVFAKELDFNHKLTYSLKSFSELKNIEHTCFESLDMCTLHITYNNSTTVALISTKVDPYFQIAALQQILKTATIKHNRIDFIDLSSSRAYATLKNN